MSVENLLVREMAEHCLLLITESQTFDPGLPEPLQKKHLLWMCHQVVINANDWHAGKLHRWLGFVQCALMANRVVDLDGLKSMFNKAKIAFGDTGVDLFDHLNPDDSFRLDIGGEG